MKVDYFFEEFLAVIDDLRALENFLKNLQKKEVAEVTEELFDYLSEYVSFFTESRIHYQKVVCFLKKKMLTDKRPDYDIFWGKHYYLFRADLKAITAKNNIFRHYKRAVRSSQETYGHKENLGLPYSLDEDASLKLLIEKAVNDLPLIKQLIKNLEALKEVYLYYVGEVVSPDEEIPNIIKNEEADALPETSFFKHFTGEIFFPN